MYKGAAQFQQRAATISGRSIDSPSRGRGPRGKAPLAPTNLPAEIPHPLPTWGSLKGKWRSQVLRTPHSRANLMAVIAPLAAAGASPNALADALNANGYRTMGGTLWHGGGAIALLVWQAEKPPRRQNRQDFRVRYRGSDSA